jgi:hypothetical protein
MDDEQVRLKLYELIDNQDQDALFSFLDEHGLSLEDYLFDDGSHPIHYAAQNSSSTGTSSMHSTLSNFTPIAKMSFLFCIFVLFPKLPLEYHTAELVFPILCEKSLTTPCCCRSPELADSVDALIAYDEEAINEVNAEGETPLHVAVRRNDEDSAKILISAGADINAAVQGVSVYSGYTPLHFAASQGFLSIATMLLDRKDIRLSGGSSFGHVGAPLHVACLSGNETMTLLLLSRGADATELTSFGHTPLAVSASKGYDTFVTDYAS